MANSKPFGAKVDKIRIILNVLEQFQDRTILFSSNCACKANGRKGRYFSAKYNSPIFQC